MMPEQVVGRGLDRPQALPLVVGQRRVEDQLGHAEDGVHGGADLVADVGQELVLGPVGRLRRLLGLPQLLLLNLAFDPQGDHIRHRPERLEYGLRERPSGEDGQDPSQAGFHDQGVTRESDHPLTPGPHRVAEAWVAEEVVGQVRPAFLSNPPDLEMADRDPAVGAVDVGVQSGAGLQHQDVLTRTERPDPGEGRVEVLHQGLGAGLEDPSQGVARVKASPTSRPSSARRARLVSPSSARFRSVTSRMKATNR